MQPTRAPEPTSEIVAEAAATRNTRTHRHTPLTDTHPYPTRRAAGRYFSGQFEPHRFL